MKECVLDTSVIIKWFSEYDEDDLDKALRLRNEILEGIYSATVPELMFYELANALRYNPKFTIKDVKDAVNSVFDIGFYIREIDALIMEHAVEIAYKYNVTVYDSYFLALSQLEKKPFVTADIQFAKHMKFLKNIVRLSEI